MSFLNETVAAIWGEKEGQREGQVTRRRREDAPARSCFPSPQDVTLRGRGELKWENFGLLPNSSD